MHSTEMAVLQVLSELMETVDKRDMNVFILLDSSTAFDTVNHDILLSRWPKSFGVDETSHLVSVLSSRPDAVRPSRRCPFNQYRSPHLLYWRHTSQLRVERVKLSLSTHLHCRLQNVCTRLQLDEVKQPSAECNQDCKSRSALYNPSPTPVADVCRCVSTASWLTRWRQYKISASLLTPTRTVMTTHVQRTVSRCIAELFQLRYILQLVPPATLRHWWRLSFCLVMDYGNGVLIGLSAHLLRWLRRTECISAVDLPYVVPTTSLIRSSIYIGCARTWIQFKI